MMLRSIVIGGMRRDKRLMEGKMKEVDKGRKEEMHV